MALHLPTFFTRLGSAIVFSIVMMAGFLSNEWAFLALFLVVCFLCLKEYAKLLENIFSTQFRTNEKVNFIVVGLALFLWVAALPLGTCASTAASTLQPFLFQLLGICLGALAIFFLFRKNKSSIYLLSGLGYISLSLGLFVQLRYQSLLLPLILILFIWMNDSLAYLTGSFFGKTPFAPNISPKKTIEGTVGGILFTLVFAGIWGYNTHWFALPVWFSFGLIASLIGTIGDLVESKLKRMANVKDSGQIMPGHGGALDRFDSLLLAAPFAFLCGLLFDLCFQYTVF